MTRSETIRGDTITSGACRACRGTGRVTVIVCGPSVSGVREVRCLDCRGAGVIDDDRFDELAAGMRRRADRLERGLTQRQEAERLGMDHIAYSKLENVP